MSQCADLRMQHNPDPRFYKKYQRKEIHLGLLDNQTGA